MKKFHIVGAFDRHNYGDILFPLIHSEIIKRATRGAAEINYYAITPADLTTQGGVTTQSIKALIQKSPKEDEVVIMSGGDILAADWPTMAGHVSSPATYFCLRALFKILGFSISNSLIKGIWLQKNDFPYILSKKTIKPKVYYSCVGGSWFIPKNDRHHLDRVSSELRQVDGISVRDTRIQKLLATKNIKARLVPDSALIMSDIYPLASLETRNWKASLRKSHSFSVKNFIVFQCAKNCTSNNLKHITKQLSEISNKIGTSILLLPIGRATGHEDHVVLEQVYNSLSQNGVPCAIQDSAHVLDIMASIAFSKSYIGTSLHGAITSYSFGHKVCGIMTEKVKKLDDFVSTWMHTEDFHLALKTDFSESFIALTQKSHSISNTRELESHKKAIYDELSLYR